MRASRPVILTVLFLAAGLALTFVYSIKTTSMTMGYPFSGSDLQLAIAASEPAPPGGLALTAISLRLLVWAFIWAAIGEVGLMNSARNMLKRKKRTQRQERMNRAVLKQLQKRLDDLA